MFHRQNGKIIQLYLGHFDCSIAGLQDRAQSALRAVAQFASVAGQAAPEFFIPKPSAMFLFSLVVKHLANHWI